MTDAQPTGQHDAHDAVAKRRHEESDAQARPLFLAFAGLFGLLIVVFVAMWAVFAFFDKRAAESEEQRIHVGSRPHVRPPGPLLQIRPAVDLNQMLDREKRQMETYGWVNKASGIVRIPVDHAMDLVIENGLPDLPPIGQEDTRPGVNPGVTPPGTATPAGQPGSSPARGGRATHTRRQPAQR